ncbi:MULTISPECIES: Holliday junction resolvase RuvX [Priestia]|jgi:putative holliday junction resolvase|uniref:Putative pre-16S rRNA nuclease n=6 Tax=Priestia TaxID=2800373 RepID=D5DT01_PRIM1|nr:MULTISPECIES: Holliday junction resolvase RuvX [Priestia]AVX10488.1 Holliday junction resolvase RuvX [Bacillus sp. Y-01]KOP76565.1 Holliday junction resolvase [Bacillus sp. FJAT-21351]KQU14496.1 Holliday junction resolvase [Bacillus sp. Leaf75]KRD89314.1 Holliday junction resolvase [Bacillus sp. Root147]KRD92420.1 Holliday junction resolvase [Bacillus sp. Root239]KRF57868.1 Holliday junction resolvase [Bacillus sp. Soil531]MBK0007816.1 Holliday junction resolvase RuvX [Bacillus sp. S35]M
MRVLGLDVGTKTIGVAVSDEMGWTAQGIETIKIADEQMEQSYPRLQQLIDEYSVEKIVVGLPKNMNGTIGPRGEACIEFADNVKEKLNIETMMWDERLSTMAAERVLLSADVSRKKRKKVIDKMAAVMILQGYLDSKQ